MKHGRMTDQPCGRCTHRRRVLEVALRAQVEGEGRGEGEFKQDESGKA